MMNCAAYQPSQMALPYVANGFAQAPLSWPIADQYSVGSDAALTASTLAALQALATTQNLSRVQAAPITPPLACETLDDLTDCVSDLSDLESCDMAPSLASVYELSCALSPASSADSVFSADVDFERTSPLQHYSPVPSVSPPLQDAAAVNRCFAGSEPSGQTANTCAANVVAAQDDTKPLLRKPIDMSKLNSIQVQRLLRRRERNKIAASKCRRKTKQKAASIRDELNEANTANAELRREVELLRAEKEKLERILASHNCVVPDCGNAPATPPTTPNSAPCSPSSEDA